jgi:hypothetical protein
MRSAEARLSRVQILSLTIKIEQYAIYGRIGYARVDTLSSDNLG